MSSAFLGIVVSAIGCFLAILFFVILVSIFDCIIESREEKK